jgi:hypothetical protein
VRDETLVRMANQIAANTAGAGEGASGSRILEHMRTFWTPGMMLQLNVYARANPEALDPRVHAALAIVPR